MTNCNGLAYWADSVSNSRVRNFDYDAQGRIVGQRRGGNANGSKCKYKESTNKLLSVDGYISGYDDGRDMSDPENFVYDQEGNLIV